MNFAPRPQAERVITAAGGVLLRKIGSDEQVCIVLRKERNDWTLPKGKLEPGESFQEAAFREVKEETGCDGELGEYLGAIGYKAAGTPKVVLFWRMVPVNETLIPCNEEIIRHEWLSIRDALDRLTYEPEKNFLARITGVGEFSEGLRRGSSWLDRLFHLRRGRARLARELEVFDIELGCLEARSNNSDKTWAAAARHHLAAAKRYEKAGEIEGGWVCLHAAQRQVVFGLDSKELLIRAEIVRLEAKKISSWRAQAIGASLREDTPLTPERLNFAMGLRDEHFANQYHKVWLTGDQLGILIKICGPALFLLTLVVTFRSQTFSNYSSAGEWGWPVVVAVMIFGLLGASFSCAQSLIGDIGSRSIPQRVADHYVTLTRILSGAIVGVASYAFYVSKMIPIKILEGSIAAAFTIAFIFGYTGEKLLARVIDKGAEK